jgi:hypothetical protein
MKYYIVDKYEDVTSIYYIGNHRWYSTLSNNIKLFTTRYYAKKYITLNLNVVHHIFYNGIIHGNGCYVIKSISDEEAVITKL